jgi:hypothetical protein
MHPKPSEAAQTMGINMAPRVQHSLQTLKWDQVITQATDVGLGGKATDINTGTGYRRTMDPDITTASGSHSDQYAASGGNTTAYGYRRGFRLQPRPQASARPQE